VSELAHLAADPLQTRGRLHPEPETKSRGPRTIYQRDRDRIIHSISFRRLRHKTQVFIAPDGDHFRVRLTHSLEVAQIGRTIARALGLNEDLTEALCLAHDIGHPPFGHAGEDALSAKMIGAGGFDHNGNTLRILSQLESPYPRWSGLNLSWEMLEGLAKHNGPVTAPGWALAEADAAYPLDLAQWPSLEAQVAAVADDIAYDNHDIDDGLRAGLLDREDLLAQPLIAPGWRDVVAGFPDIAEDRLLPELVRHQIGMMVNDVIAETRRRVAASGVATAQDVRRAGQALCGFSDDVALRETSLKAFMYTKLYHHPQQLVAADVAQRIISGLFDTYRDDPAALPADWRGALPCDEPGRTRHIGDFIAGMTDRFAISRYLETVGQIDVPDGF
jgi:dGTPase